VIKKCNLPCKWLSESAVEVGREEAGWVSEGLHMSEKTAAGESWPHAVLHVQPLGEAANLAKGHLMSI
jgi:hypothetical protein